MNQRKAFFLQRGSRQKIATRDRLGQGSRNCLGPCWARFLGGRQGRKIKRHGFHPSKAGSLAALDCMPRAAPFGDTLLSLVAFQ
jgi:hypothetical protein